MNLKLRFAVDEMSLNIITNYKTSVYFDFKKSMSTRQIIYYAYFSLVYITSNTVFI